jgi:hypothetical protein
MRRTVLPGMRPGDLSAFSEYGTVSSTPFSSAISPTDAAEQPAPAPDPGPANPDVWDPETDPASPLKELVGV